MLTSMTLATGEKGDDDEEEEKDKFRRFFLIVFPTIHNY